MESYRFKNNDLFHGIGFNYYTLESILKYGILSKKEAVKENIPLAKNYDGYNMDDTISLVNTAYTNIDDLGSAYHAFIENGISFLVDRKIEYIYDKNKRYINRPDEVLVLDKIDTTCLKKIIIPEKKAYSLVGSTKIIPNTSYNYFNIKDITLNYVNFIEKKIPVDLEYVSELLYELKTTVNAIRAEVKKSKFPSEKDDKEINAIFSSKDLNYDNEKVNSLDLNAVFGGVKCDLRNAKLDKEVVINTCSVFGGIDIYVKEDTKVLIKSTSLFGGVENRATQNKDSKITIHVNYTCIFGGIEIR